MVGAAGRFIEVESGMLVSQDVVDPVGQTAIPGRSAGGKLDEHFDIVFCVVDGSDRRAAPGTVVVDVADIEPVTTCICVLQAGLKQVCAAAELGKRDLSIVGQGEAVGVEVVSKAIGCAREGAKVCGPIEGAGVIDGELHPTMGTGQGRAGALAEVAAVGDQAAILGEIDLVTDLHE